MCPVLNCVDCESCPGATKLSARFISQAQGVLSALASGATHDPGQVKLFLAWLSSSLESSSLRFSYPLAMSHFSGSLTVFFLPLEEPVHVTGSPDDRSEMLLG